MSWLHPHPAFVARYPPNRYQAHVPTMGLLRQRLTPTSTCAIHAEEAVTTPTIHNRKRVETVEGIWFVILCVLDLYVSWIMYMLNYVGPLCL
ncbi:hypothetical protein BS78_05G109600 [Paspalum vaginatum]|nr:hypothetical protein BS78_05G109600 [Paspalum vaginatum]